MIRIVHIITGLSTGGAEISLYRILSKLSANFEPFVISLCNIGEVGGRIRDLKIPVESLNMKPGVPNPIAIFLLVIKLLRLKPDLVHTWMYHADLIGGLAAKLAGVRSLTWAIRNSDLSIDKTKKTTRAVARTCAMLSRRLPNRIVSCSYKARDIHVALGYDESRFVIIPNGFDLSCFSPDSSMRSEVRKELGIPINAPVIGLVARLDVQKNHKGFFQAAGILHKTRADVHFVLAGNEIEAKNPIVSSWVKNARIEKVTHLLGLRKDIPRLTTAFDIATSSSWGEAFPNVVGEAMACGVPCVVTDVGDSAYIVGDTGLVVQPGNIQGLASAWERLLSLSPEERRSLGERARSRVEKNFELGTIVRRYESLYEELTNF